MNTELPNYISEFNETYQKEAHKIFMLFKDIFPLEKYHGLDCSSIYKQKMNYYSNKFTILPIIWEQWIWWVFMEQVTKKTYYRAERQSFWYSAFCKDILSESQKHFPIHECIFKFYFSEFLLQNFNISKTHSFLTVLNKAFPYDICLHWIKTKEDFDHSYRHAIQALKCPHANLEENLLYCLAFSDSPRKAEFIQLYNKNAKIYKDIVSEIDNDENFLNCLKETDYNDCIVQNIEYRISNNPANKKLWKIYISFLYESKLDVLSVIKRYCRLFLDDREMRRMYRQAIGKFCENYQSKWWIDLIEIENDFESNEIALKLMKSIIQEEFSQHNYDSYFDGNHNFTSVFESFKKMAKAKDTKIVFILKKSQELPYLPYQSITSLRKTIFNYSFPQNFCFPMYLINYISKNGTSYNLQNLKMSCKFFISKIPVNYCHMLLVYEEGFKLSFSKQSVFTNHLLFFNKSKNICLTNSVVIHHRSFNFNQFITHKFYNCGVRYISLAQQAISYSQFLFLTSSGKIEYLFLSDVSISHGNDREIFMEEIMALVPNAQYLHFKHRFYNTQIFTNTFVKYKHPVTIKFFKMSITDRLIFNAAHFYIFMMNNANKDARFCLDFLNSFEKDKKKTIKTDMIELLEQCWIIHDEINMLTFEHKKMD